jgi:CBS domain containing-hemolysin-like protein
MKTKTAIILVLLLMAALLVEARTRGKQPRAQGKGRRSHREALPHYLTPNQPEFWFNCILATCTSFDEIVLAVAGGFCSGMTVGLNSLSILNLEIMQKSSDPKAKAMADRILAVISDHHLFLTTLLVGNAIVLESLPLVIHLIMPDWAAIIFSTVVVLVVAEVVPMSWSTGSHKYIIAYYGSPLVSLMIKAFWPLCYPMARGLDNLLGGDHEERILRRDFLTFINDRRKVYYGVY